MNEITLVKPSMEYTEAIAEFRKELLDTESEFAGCGTLHDCESAEEWIALVDLNETARPERPVPSSSYLAVRLSDNRIVGMIDLRHHIDHPILSTWGGHMGYTVRPSERRRGYAKEMLRQNLENCRDRGMDRVLITCDNDNVASEKVITANGGVFERVIEVDDGLVKRYWVEL